VTTCRASLRTGSSQRDEDMKMSDWRQRIANLSPEELARFEAALRQKTRAGSGGQTIQRRESAGPCRLSFAQERLWFLDQFEPQSPVYNICRAVHLEGPLDRSALQKGLNEVVARHESLRTVFRSEDGIPLQVVTSDHTVALDVIELDDQRGALREEEIQHLLRRECQRPFDLSRDLMLRATLLRLHEEEHWLLLVMHHIASDG
jgi:hypothetical protein